MGMAGTASAGFDAPSNSEETVSHESAHPSATGSTSASDAVADHVFNTAPAVKQFPLDERVVYEVPISTDAPTTLLFPSAPTALESAGISANPAQPAPVLLSHVPGRYYFSVRAMRPDARATLNVVHKNRAYIIRFKALPAPFGTVTFYEDNLAGRSPALTQRATPEALLALLDRAKSYRLLREQHPEIVQPIEHRVPSRNNVTHYRDFTATVEEVFRFEPEDTLVFRIRLQNTSAAEIAYRPRSLAARVGQRVYPASIADASGLIPPRSESIAYFAITSTPSGARAHLSVKNNFTILVPRIASRSVAPRGQSNVSSTPVEPTATSAQPHEIRIPSESVTPTQPPGTSHQ
jgi:hypothetical protein